MVPVGGNVGMTKRDRLGKGLGALLGEYLEPGPGAEAGATVPVARIGPNPYQPRREFAEEELAELEASIRENGLLQPIVVRPGRANGGPEWELVAGERRWRAVTRLGWREIPAVVREVDDRTLLILALVENLQRSQLTPLEEAAAYRRLSDEFGLSARRVAEVVGKDRSTVANSLRLLNLPASVRSLLAEGKLTAGHARALLGVENELRMVDLARQAAEAGWSVRDVEARVQRMRPGAGRPAAKAKAAADPAERRLEEELQRALGTAARILRRSGTRGKIEIPFYDAEDFDRVFEMLVGKPTADVVN